MTDPHPIRCACGAVTGNVDGHAWVNRVICYCDDCQAFADHLGRADEVLDARGGSDIVQTAPRFVTFTEGREHLACTRITPNGLLRWYAACCRTPIGNTPANRRFAFVGLLHSCLGGPTAVDASFGPPRMRVFTRFAKGEPKPDQQVPVAAAARLAWRLAAARLGAGHRTTPFFDAAGNPVATPELASRAAGRPR